METMEIWQIIGFTLMLLVMMYLTSSLDKSMKDTERHRKTVKYAVG